MISGLQDLRARVTGAESGNPSRVGRWVGGLYSRRFAVSGSEQQSVRLSLMNGPSMRHSGALILVSIQNEPPLRSVRLTSMLVRII